MAAPSQQEIRQFLYMCYKKNNNNKQDCNVIQNQIVKKAGLQLYVFAVLGEGALITPVYTNGKLNI